MIDPRKTDFKEQKLNNHSTITVHASATKPSMDIGFEEIDQWHKNRGWNGCGYHLIIRRNGAYEMGRDWGIQGAHVKGHNAMQSGLYNFGIVMIGGVTEEDHTVPEDNFTRKQYQALTYALKEIMEYNPNIKEFKGHNEWPGVTKACPCFDIKEYRRWFNNAMQLNLPRTWWKVSWKTGRIKDFNQANEGKTMNTEKDQEDLLTDKKKAEKNTKKKTLGFFHKVGNFFASLFSNNKDKS